MIQSPSPQIVVLKNSLFLRIKIIHFYSAVESTSQTKQLYTPNIDYLTPCPKHKLYNSPDYLNFWII